MPAETQPLWEFVNVTKQPTQAYWRTTPSLKLLEGAIHGLSGRERLRQIHPDQDLGGVQQPDSGEILCKRHGGQDPQPDDARDKGIAAVFQEFSIVPTLSVGENILLGNMPRSRFGAIDWAKINSDAAAVLKGWQSTFRPEAITGHLSVAEQQLVEIAKAVAMRRPDAHSRRAHGGAWRGGNPRLHGLLEDAGRGTAILYVSHRLDEVERIVDEVTILRDGQVVVPPARPQSTSTKSSTRWWRRCQRALSEKSTTPPKVVLEARGLSTRTA